MSFSSKNPWSFGLFYMDIKDKINYEYNAYYVGKYVNVDKYHAYCDTSDEC